MLVDGGGDPVPLAPMHGAGTAAAIARVAAWLCAAALALVVFLEYGPLGFVLLTLLVVVALVGA